VGLEESPEAVAWQTTQLLSELAAVGATGVQVAAGTASDPLWSALVENQGKPAFVTLKANLLPSAVAGFCLALKQRPEAWRVQAQAGSGIVWASVDDEISLDALKATLDVVRPLAQQASGNITLPRCPETWKGPLPIWGTTRGDAVVMRKIKLALDPHGLFNPGRFLEGIE
jgi:glycolate oxidase FAD binding subunit